MKWNDIGDSYLLWLIERVLATRRVHPRRRTITPSYAGQHSAQPSRMLSRQPLEMPGRYRFHSTRPADFPRKAQRPRRNAACLSLQLRGGVDDLVARQKDLLC